MDSIRIQEGFQWTHRAICIGIARGICRGLGAGQIGDGRDILKDSIEAPQNFYRIGSHSILKDYKEVWKGFQKDSKDLLRILIDPKECQRMSLGFQRISQRIPMDSNDSTEERAKPNNINKQAVRSRHPKTLGCSSRLAPSPSPRPTHPPSS